MLFFVICAAFALFPAEVLYGAQNGLALCINAVIPSLLPFMVASSCIIKSNFARPLGAVLSKVITPLTGISRLGCVCFVTGLVGGYGAGARAVLESYKAGDITKEEAERLLPLCNNAGPLFIIATVGVGFYSSKITGAILFLIQLLNTLIVSRIFSGSFGGEKKSIKEEWSFYKKNKLPIGKLITKSAIESGSAIITACVFVIAFSAVLEVLPFGEYSLLSGFLEVTRGTGEMARRGEDFLPLTSAVLAWGGMSVHLQADALCAGEFNMKRYYFGKFISAVTAFLITKIVSCDINLLILFAVLFVSVSLCVYIIKTMLLKAKPRQHVFRQRRHS